ncbi:MAG TPA: N-acetyltransferase [Caulobacteraceae bacterium]|nr:N-acetyltransferase [Caulobacteraceae bacterium]
MSDGLIAGAFGPGRYAKAAERLREGSEPAAGLSFLAWIDGRAVGAVRLWPIVIGETAALLLGPIAVDEADRGAGIGAALVRRACEAASAAGHHLILLVGDEEYFARMGFAAAPARRIEMPGPVDQNRVLAKGLTAGAADALAGPARAAPKTAEVRPETPLARVAS